MDNTNALFGHVKGVSGWPPMDRIVTFTQFLSARFETRTYYEYVASAANWSDDASRLLEADPFLALAGFRTLRVPDSLLIRACTASPCDYGW